MQDDWPDSAREKPGLLTRMLTVVISSGGLILALALMAGRLLHR